MSNYINLGYFENIAVEYVPGATPTAFFYDKENNEIDSVLLVSNGDIELEDLKTLLSQHGFELRRPILPVPALTAEITLDDVHYQFYGPGKLYFKEAEDFASSLSHNGEKGRLLTFSCKLQEDKITEWISSISPDALTWLGVSDQDVEGEWKWSNGKLLDGQGYSNWHENEPNNADNEDCAAYKLNSGWNDVSCDNSAQLIVEFGPFSPRICESALNPVQSDNVDHLEVNL